MPDRPYLPTTFVHELKVPQLVGPPGREGTALALAFGADSRLLALGGYLPVIELWDSHAGTLIGRLSGHASSMVSSMFMGTVYSLAFSPDGWLLASGGRDKTVRLWRSSDGACVNVLDGFSGAVEHLAFSPVARVLAAAERDAVRLFDLDSGAVTPVPLSEGGINSLCFSSDGTVLAVAPGGRATRKGSHPVALVDPSSARTVRTIEDVESPVLGLAFSPDGRSLALVPRSGREVQFWDTVSWQKERVLSGSPIYDARRIVFSSQGALGIAIGDKTCVLDPSTDTKPIKLRSPGTPQRMSSLLAFSPDGRMIARCVNGGKVRIYR